MSCTAFFLLDIQMLFSKRGNGWHQDGQGQVHKHNCVWLVHVRLTPRLFAMIYLLEMRYQLHAIRWAVGLELNYPLQKSPQKITFAESQCSSFVLPFLRSFLSSVCIFFLFQFYGGHSQTHCWVVAGNKNRFMRRAGAANTWNYFLPRNLLKVIYVSPWSHHYPEKHIILVLKGVLQH